MPDGSLFFFSGSFSPLSYVRNWRRLEHLKTMMLSSGLILRPFSQANPTG